MKFVKEHRPIIGAPQIRFRFSIFYLFIYLFIDSNRPKRPLTLQRGHIQKKLQCGYIQTHSTTH